MTTWFWIIIVFLIIQRLIELFIARRNEAWMIRQGAIERGAQHYKWFIVLHVLFFISMITEALPSDIASQSFNYYLFAVFLVTQLARIWCMVSLGKFWNTKVIILPGAGLRTQGPYRFIKHPNYVIVGIELFVIPLLLGATLTAVIFPLLHIFIVLHWRLPVENQALAEVQHINKTHRSPHL